MIDLQFKITNEEAVKGAGVKINAKRAMFYGDLAVAMKVLQYELTRTLEKALGDTFKHFTVYFGANQYDYYIAVRPIGDIGRILLEGHEDSYPIGDDGQVLENMDGTFGPVRGPVMHPGFIGKREIIEREMREGLMKVKLLMIK